MACCFRSRERGSLMVEFALCLVVFFAFITGLFVASYWGIGAAFLQEAAHEAAQKYAVTMDAQAAENRARAVLGKWGYAFVDPGTVSVSVWKDGDRARAAVSAAPRVKKLYLYEVKRIAKESSCTFEYRFRNPEEYLW